MKWIAPIVIIGLFSAALYKTQDVWPKTEYDLEFGQKTKAAAASASGPAQASN